MGAESFYQEAQQHAVAGRHQDAVRAHSEALALDDRHTKARFGRGLALHRLGELAAALEDLVRVVNEQPGCAEAFYSRAAIHYDSAAYLSALTDCNEALRLKPDCLDALYLRDHAESPQSVRAGPGRSRCLARTRSFLSRSLLW